MAQWQKISSTNQFGKCKKKAKMPLTPCLCDQQLEAVHTGQDKANVANTFVLRVKSSAGIWITKKKK